MTRIAQQLNRGLFNRREDEYARVWWTAGDLCTELAGSQIYFSDVVPNNAIITEVQIQTRPFALDTQYQGRIWLKIVESDQISEAQILQGESVVRFLWGGIEYGWANLGLVHDDLWLCRKIMKGAHMRIAVIVSIAGAGNMAWRTAVQYRMP